MTKQKTKSKTRLSQTSMNFTMLCRILDDTMTVKSEIRVNASVTNTSATSNNGT